MKTQEQANAYCWASEDMQIFDDALSFSFHLPGFSCSLEESR